MLLMGVNAACHNLRTAALLALPLGAGAKLWTDSTSMKKDMDD